MTAYDRLTARFARIATIGEASSVLGWDAATMMPPGGGSARGDQLAVLAGMSHSLLVAPVVGDDLAEAFDAVFGERGYAVFTNAIDMQAAVFGEHVDREVVQPVLILAKDLGDIGDGEDGCDGSQGQAA